ncbi:MAG: DUF1648 domain-containing protein [Peptostreptococcaceae bacterium]|nr:DUF1648 domain-containing protein [Peptostreptococcaceae bacterium]
MPKPFLIFFNSIHFVILIGLFRLIPDLSKRNIVLGVTLSEEGLKRPKIRQMVAHFKSQVTKIGIFFWVFVIVYTYFYPDDSATVSASVSMIYIVTGSVIYARSHDRVKKWKAENGFYIEEQKIAVDLKMSSRRAKKKSLLWYYVPSLVVSLIPIILSIKNYDRLPEQIPTHYDLYLEPDIFAPKSPGAVLFPYIFSIVMACFFMLSNYLMRVSRKNFGPGDLEDAIIRSEKAEFWWGICFGAISLSLSFLMALTYLPMSGVKIGRWMALFMISVLILSIASPIVVGLKVGTSGERLRSKTIEGRNASYDDDDKWLWGILYYDPGDPATFVPKKVGVGYTINMATAIGKIFIGVTIMVIVFLVLSPFLL